MYSMIKGNAGVVLFWSTSNLRSQRHPREAPSETLRSYGVDTVTIYVSAANCYCLNSVTGITGNLIKMLRLLKNTAYFQLPSIALLTS